MVTNNKVAFRKVPFRHNSVYVIQKWLRFKRVMTVMLAYVSFKQHEMFQISMLLSMMPTPLNTSISSFKAPPLDFSPDKKHHVSPLPP